MFLAVALPGILLLGGLGLLVVGRRGRVIDDHPLCRRCGFDLFGLPKGVHICSECGANVAEPGAVRIGHRRALRRWVAAGSVLMFVSAAWLGLVGWVVTKGIDVNQYKPVWMLLNEAAGNDVATRDAALAELLSRVTADKASAARLSPIFDRALVVQEDLRKPWLPIWGDIIEWGHHTGKLSQEQWHRYIRQAPVIVMEVRPRIRRGAPLPVRREYTARVGERSMFVKRKGVISTIDGVPCDDRMGRGLELAALSNSYDATPSQISPADPALTRLADGPHTMKWTLDLWAYDTAPRSFDDPRPAIAKGRRAFEALFQVVPEHTVALLTQPELQGRIASAITVQLNNNGSKVAGWITVISSPAPVGFDVFIRSGGREKKAGRLAVRAGEGRQGWYLSADLSIATDKCDVVLLPSREAAEETIDMIEIWDGEIVLRNVTMVRADK